MLKKRWRYGVVTLAAVLGSTVPAAKLADLPAPGTLVSLLLNRDRPSRSGTAFPSVPVAAAPRPSPIAYRPLDFAVRIPWGTDGWLSLDEFERRTRTQALLILHRNDLVYEKYRNGATRNTLFPSFSVAKSVVAVLLRIAVAEGHIRSLSDPVTAYVPGLPPAYAQVRIDDLLNMRSGIPVEERPTSVFSTLAYMYLTTDLDKFVTHLDGLDHAGKSRFEYRSVDYLLLGRAIASATGVSLARYLETKVWQPMGAQYPATWSVDSADTQVEKAFCCLNARAIDFARFGLVNLHGGAVQGVRVLPASSVGRPPASASANPAFDYGGGWWLPRMGAAGADYTAIGIHGQYVYVDPATQTVIVKLSDHGAEQDEALTVGAFRALAAELARLHAPPARGPASGQGKAPADGGAPSLRKTGFTP